MPFWLGDRGPIPCPLVSSRWKFDGDYNPVLFSSRPSAMGTLGFYSWFWRDLGSDTPSLCSSRSSIDGDLYPAHDSSRLVRDGDSRIRFLVTPSC